MTINDAILQIESALLQDDSEPGVRDNEWGELVITEIGFIRLKRILTEFRKPKKKSPRKSRP